MYLNGLIGDEPTTQLGGESPFRGRVSDIGRLQRTRLTRLVELELEVVYPHVLRMRGAQARYGHARCIDVWSSSSRRAVARRGTNVGPFCGSPNTLRVEDASLRADSRPRCADSLTARQSQRGHSTRSWVIRTCNHRGLMGRDRVNSINAQRWRQTRSHQGLLDQHTNSIGIE